MPQKNTGAAMSNSKEIKERMTGIRETMKITNAMYLISSSKMKQAKQKLAETEPFFFAMQREISKILSYWPETGGITLTVAGEFPKKKRRLASLL